MTISTTKQPRKRRFRMRSAAAALAAVAVGAGILGTAPAAMAADSDTPATHGATSWPHSMELKVGGKGGIRHAQIDLELDKVDQHGEPIEGVEFTVEWVEDTPTSVTPAWIDGSVWENTRDRDREQRLIDLRAERSDVEQYSETAQRVNATRDALDRYDWAAKFDAETEAQVAELRTQAESLAAEHPAQADYYLGDWFEAGAQEIRDLREENRGHTPTVADTAAVLEQYTDGVPVAELDLDAFRADLESEEAEIASAVDALDAQIDPLVAQIEEQRDALQTTEFVVTTDADGDADLTLLGNLMYDSAAYAGGHLVITETAVPEGVSDAGVGATAEVRLGDGSANAGSTFTPTGGSLTTTNTDVFVGNSGAFQYAWDTGLDTHVWAVSLDVVNERDKPDAPEPPVDEPEVPEPPTTDIPDASASEPVPPTTTIRPPVVSG